MARTLSNTADMGKLLQRIANLEEDRAQINEDIASVWAEAKAGGLNVKALRKVHALKKIDKEDLVTIKSYAEALSVFD